MTLDHNESPRRNPARTRHARMAALTAACLALLAGRPVQAQWPAAPCGGSATEPCPGNLERMCNSPSTESGGGLATACECACGPGGWVTPPPKEKRNPYAPYQNCATDYSFNGCNWQWDVNAKTEQNASEASVSVLGIANSSSAVGSISRQAQATHSTVWKEEWVGAGPACPRLVTLCAVGSVTMGLTVTCGARLGCSAAGSVSAGGSCQSIANASASLPDKSLNGTAFYESVSSSTNLSGKFGASVVDRGIGVEGSISSKADWKVSGSGSAAGTAVYVVSPNRSYCAFTNRAYDIRSNGAAIAVATGSVGDRGSIWVQVAARVFFDVM